ncbi:MAG TPA: ArsC/Spx/MgsR family protein [Rhodocyclaceae bacterium]
MAVVTFYEKPGCSGNAKQKQALEAAGHTVVAKDLLTRHWTRSELLSYFEGLPVAQWFNRNSPAVKSGEIVPDSLDEETALGLLQRHPLLIRRPLLEADGVRRAGFDVAAVHAWIGLGLNPPGDDMEACQHGTEGHVCQGHAADEPCGHH